MVYVSMWSVLFCAGVGRGVEVPLFPLDPDGVVEVAAVAGALSWPPNVRFDTDCAEWMAIWRWKAISSRRRAGGVVAGIVSAF